MCISWQYKQNQKMICLSALMTIQSLSEIRGVNLALYGYLDGKSQLMKVLIIIK